MMLPAGNQNAVVLHFRLIPVTSRQHHPSWLPAGSIIDIRGRFK
jgi:hypothetical protein